MNAIKIRVLDKTYCTAVQQALFRAGYRWANHGAEVYFPDYCEAKYLYASSDGYISHGSYDTTFAADSGVEHMLFQGELVPAGVIADFSGLEARILAMDETTEKKVVIVDELDETVQRRHVLRSWVKFFNGIVAGTRTSDIRYTGDREFRVGDELLLQEYDPVEECYTGREVLVKITYIQNNNANPCAISHLAIKDDYAVLSIAKC